VKITIDNLDGHGAVDYSRWISAAGPLKVKRTLNAPSLCECTLDLTASQLPAPIRRGRVVVTLDDGSVVFTGYVAKEPEAIYAGAGIAGAAYHLGLHAISDEWLLDRQGLPASGARFQQNGADAFRTLTNRMGLPQFTSAATGGLRSVGVFEPEQNASWSANAGCLADSLYGAYRVIGGVVGLQPAGTVTHVLSDGDARLQVAGLQLSQTRELANDITVSGEIEPAAYIAESFAGDGTMSAFALSVTPFQHGISGVRSHRLSDSFDAEVLDRRVWSIADPGSHFSLTSAGLTLSGGNGLDGQTTLSAIDEVEIGGSLLLEMGSVQMQAASDGVLCGLYNGRTSRATCFAGYNIRQNSGSTVVAPLINGVETGTVFTLQSGHAYTLRIRVHCVEVQRVRQLYYAMVGGIVRTFGGGAVDAPVDLVFDLQDTGSSSNTPAIVLYDGTLYNSPPICSFVPVNSVQLIGSAGYCRLTEAGSAWVTKTSAAGVRSTQTAGTAGEGVDCTISSAGKITFFTGQVPQAGELVTVRYRTSQRAIARIEDPTSVAVEAASGVPGTAQWRGKVVRPAARSTTDCENAAEALLSVATDLSAGMGGAFTTTNSMDVWPGDVLSISRNGMAANSLIRSVTLVDGMAAPELVTQHVAFESEWAQGLGIRVSESVATDVVLPQVAQTGVGSYQANLSQLTLISASGTALQVDAGVPPPQGGGFEIRRRDGGFGAAVDQDLVMRSPVRGFVIPREAQVERYYVRMYDGSKPPIYSRFSSAIFTNVPVG